MTCGYIQSDYHEINSNEKSCLDWKNKTNNQTWKWWTRYSRHSTSIESVVKTHNAHNHYWIISHIFAFGIRSFAAFRKWFVYRNWKSLFFIISPLSANGKCEQINAHVIHLLIWWLLSPEQSDHMHRYGIFTLMMRIMCSQLAICLSSTCSINVIDV